MRGRGLGHVTNNSQSMKGQGLGHVTNNSQLKVRIFVMWSIANQKPGLGHVIKNNQSEAILGIASFHSVWLGLEYVLGLRLGSGLGGRVKG